MHIITFRCNSRTWCYGLEPPTCIVDFPLRDTVMTLG